MRTLTVAECLATQRRSVDAFGSRYPYKGKWHDYASPYPMELVLLPPGWVFVSICTWGLHIRKQSETDYMEDLK